MDTASERMTKGVTPHMMRGPVHALRGIATGTLSPPDISGYHVKAMTKGVTPHMMRGPDKCCLWVLQRGYLLNTELPFGMTEARCPVRPMGESGKKNGGEGRMKGKDV